MIRRGPRSEAIEFSWLIRFYVARWRGRRGARILRQQREAAARSFTYAPKHALHEASTS